MDRCDDCHRDCLRNAPLFSGEEEEEDEEEDEEEEEEEEDEEEAATGEPKEG